MNQEEFMNFIRSQSTKEEPIKDSPEVIARLKNIAEIYKRKCPFKPGDIVTPAKYSDLKYSGAPHVVLEVLEKPVNIEFENGINTEVMTSSNAFGRKIDMRFACAGSGNSPRDETCYAYWGESWQFEYYQPEEGNNE